MNAQLGNIKWVVLFFAGIVLLASCNPPVLERRLGDWQHRSGYPGLGRSGAVSFVIGTNAYVGAGYNRDNNLFLQDFYKFDAVTNTWTPISTFPGSGRQNAVAFSLNGIGYVGTGINGTNGNTLELTDFYSYTPATDTWARIADFPGVARRGAVSFVLNNIGYVGTGLNTTAGSITNGLNDFYQYDPGTNVWTPITGYPGPKVYEAFSFVINNEAYVGGGLIVRSSGSITDNSFWKYNSSSNSWQKQPNIDSLNSIVTRYNCASFSSNGLGYVVCGSPLPTASTTIFEWNPANAIWSQKTDFEGLGRTDCVGFAVPDLNTSYPVFVGLGTPSPNSSPFSDVWSFNQGITRILNN